jgi:multidrug efflux system outer membrane protein
MGNCRPAQDISTHAALPLLYPAQSAGKHTTGKLLTMLHRPIATGLSAVLASMLLVACAPLPLHQSPVTPVEVPSDWSARAGAGGTSGAPLADWWQGFSDPVLTTLVLRATEANTSIGIAQAALLQARAARDSAAAGLAPTLAGSGSAQRARNSNTTSNRFQLGLDAGWEVDLFGGNRAAVLAAEASVGASQASLGEAQVSVAAEVALNYITLRASQGRLSIASRNLASQEETLQITRWREQAGLVSGLDTEQALAAVAQTRAQLPVLQTSIDQSQHALALLTGVAAGSLRGMLQTATPVPQAPAALALALPAETLRQRSDVRATELRIAAALSQVAQAEAARLPSFRLGGSLGLNALSLGALTHGAALAAALVASVSIPVFDGGAALAQVHTRQAALDDARVRYKAAVLAALRDVEDALVALQGDRTRQLSLQAAADAATRAAELARQRYASGLVDFQTVLDTQRSELSTQDNLVSGLAAISADHVRLYKALGGGWIPDTTDTMTGSLTGAGVRLP